MMPYPLSKVGYKQIILPDGSKVRLNAASSLSYSRTFDTSDNRIVNLNGEAYFDVVADNNRPFIVRTKLQDVEVLGTKFLVESYNEEPEVKTSLYSGKIKIKRVNAEDVVLSPGQQSLVSSFAFRIIQLSDSDVSKDLERFDYIDFKGETIQQVLRKVARWYDVQIKYDGPVSEYKISGSISKDIELPKVIEMLNILFPNEIIKLKGAVVTVKLRK
ncbi:MAG: FecR family protein [Pedobacter sp.]|nr:MAG: FecR family protein [Pedobacter sp.]